MKKEILLTVDLPDWAEWLAVDSDGDIYVYSVEPDPEGSIFGVWDHADRENIKIDRVGNIEMFPVFNYEKTLRRLKDYR